MENYSGQLFLERGYSEVVICSQRLTFSVDTNGLGLSATDRVKKSEKYWEEELIVGFGRFMEFVYNNNNLE